MNPVRWKPDGVLVFWIAPEMEVVPIGNAYRSSKLIPNATLKVYPGAPHAIISTSKNQVNEDLLTFIRK
jgi:pimeloyl-ACP methyl ester carboxylesterase